MSTLFEDGLEVINLCSTGQEEQVINAMLNSSQLKTHISYLVKNDKVAFETLMHDTVLSFIRSCMKKDFVISSTPISYAKAIAKNNWLMQLRKKQISTTELYENSEFIQISNSYIIDNDRKNVVQSMLNKVPKDCQHILHLWAMKYKMREIAEIMKIDSEAYAKKKKHLCLKKLIAIIENDPKFKEELRLYV